MKNGGSFHRFLVKVYRAGFFSTSPNQKRESRPLMPFVHWERIGGCEAKSEFTQ